MINTRAISMRRCVPFRVVRQADGTGLDESMLFTPPGPNQSIRDYQITLQVKSAGAITTFQANYQVSLDGGTTWGTVDSADFVTTPVKRLAVPAAGLHRLSISGYNAAQPVDVIALIP